jgi:hypothetical protein
MPTHELAGQHSCLLNVQQAIDQAQAIGDAVSGDRASPTVSRFQLTQSNGLYDGDARVS